VNHEICTHTFSHVLGEELPRETLQSDIKQTQRTHKKMIGSTATSLVQPKHQNIDRKVLTDNGIEVVRECANEIPPGKLETLLWHFQRNHPVMDPNISEGVIETYTSAAQSLTAPYIANGQAGSHPIFQSIPIRLRKYIFKKYIDDALDRAVRNDSHAHFWTHLHDMANDRQVELSKMVLEKVARLRDMEKIEIFRMKDLSDDQLEIIE
jgi:hypothetical protein